MTSPGGKPLIVAIFWFLFHVSIIISFGVMAKSVKRSFEVIMTLTLGHDLRYCTCILGMLRATFWFSSEVSTIIIAGVMAKSLKKVI